MSDITLDQMNAKVEEIANLRTLEAAVGAEKKKITEKLESAEKQMLSMLEASNMTNYRSPLGMVTVSYRTSVKTPKTPEEKEKLFAYLRELGLYDTMISINSQTLNSFYKDQLKQAQELGKDDLEIPGISEVTINPILAFRSA